MAYTESRDVITIGDKSGRKRSIIEIPAQTVTDKPGILAFVAVDDTGVRTTYYTWFDSNGVYRYHTSVPTNQDSDGSTITSGATTTLNNLGTTSLNAALIPATGAIDLGTDAKPFRTEHLLTSLILNQTTGNYTITWANPGGARAILIPDPGADASVMLNAGAADTISFESGTSSIVLAANADLDIAAGKTVNIDQNLTVNTEAVTLNQSLSTTDTVAFATGSTIGNLTLANGSITDSGGALSFGNENLTTTGTFNIAIDNVDITLGASGATDSRIFFDGSGNLKFYDSNLGAARSLTELYTGTTLNPSVSGDLTIADGKITWTDAVAEAAGVFTFAGTSTVDIAIASSITTGTVLSVTADACANGTLLYLDADGGPGASGLFINCYNGSASEFSVGVSGTVLASTTGNVGHKISRNNATGTAPVVEIEQTHATGGVGFLVDQDATGDVNAVEVTNAGTGYSVTTTAGAAASCGYEYIAAVSGTGAGLLLDGTTGSWIGADNTGLGWIHSDGVLAAGGNLLRVTSSGLNAAGSFLVEIEQTGKVVAATDGICLKISETAAATATSYAVCIASTSNEALHVDTGLSLFDERVTITLADNTGPALAITNPDTTGNTNAVTIAPSGTGAGLQISPQGTTTMAISVVGLASSTVSAVKIDGSAGAGYLGAANVGMLHLVNDGTYADVAATELYIGNSGVPQNDSLGHCLRIVDTGNAAAGTMAYPVYISSNDATVGGVLVNTHASGNALAITAGKSNIDGPVNLGSTFFLDGTPDTANAADSAISITTSVTNLDTTIGACASMTLADGAQGQIKFITMAVDNGDATITPANPQGFATIKFTAVGQTAMLIFLASKWRLIQGYGVTVA
jgi:hypothetical protein